MFKRLAVLILAVALLAPGLLTFANGRHVFPEHFFPADGFEPGDRWEVEEGSLTVVRVLGPVIGDHSSTPPPPDLSNHQRIEGVPIRITLVQIDNLADPTNPATTSPLLVEGYPVIFYGVTDENGEVTFPDLRLGVWLVEELASATIDNVLVTNPINSTPDNSGDGPLRFEDFLVGIPRYRGTPAIPCTSQRHPNYGEAGCVDIPAIPAPPGEEWEFEVRVYPKSGFFPSDGDKVLGNIVGNVASWNLTHSIPASVQNLPYFGVTDVMSSGLEFRAPVTGSFETAPGVWRVLPATHFDVEPLVGTNGINIAINEAGLNYLGTHGLVGGTLEFVVQTIVTGPGRHVNVAEWNVGTPPCPIDDPDCHPCIPGEPDCPPCEPGDLDCPPYDYVDMFILELLKINEANQALAGASFRLYRELTAEELADLPAGVVNAGTSQNPILVTPLLNGANVAITGTTGPNGITRFNETVVSSEFHNLWLRETQAPTGYYIANEFMSITVDESFARPGVYIAGNYERTFIVDVEVLNFPEGGWRLPQTGGVGTIFLTVGGLVLVGGAVLLFVGSKKDEEVA